MVSERSKTRTTLLRNSLGAVLLQSGASSTGDSVLAANTQDLDSNALLLSSFLSLLCPRRSRFTWLAATLSDIPPGFFLNTVSNVYKVLVFSLLISGQFVMNPGMILGSTKTLIGHWIQQSGEGALCLPECRGVILPTEPPFSLPSCLGLIRECVEACLSHHVL